MEEPKMENLWQECFQDLGSWCRQPQDELNTPNFINQDEFNFSFDDQSKYYKWDDNSSQVDLKGDMWEQTDLLSPQFPVEDNNNLLVQPLVDKGVKESAIKYSGNVLLAECPYDSTSRQPDINCQTNNRIASPADAIQKYNTPPQIDFNKAATVSLVGRRQEDKIKNILPGEETRMNKPKPNLKLNITAANKACPPTTDNGAAFSMDTPDVFKSLSEDSDFSLISYVCESFNEDQQQHLLAVDPSAIMSPKPKESIVSEQVIKSDHDYAESMPSEEPRTYQSLVTMKKEDDTMPVIKEEEESRAFPIAVKEEPSSPLSSTSLGKRIRRSTTNSEDFIFDDDPPSDQSSDWSPSVKKKCKAVKKKNGGGKGSLMRRERTSSVSDSGSVTSGPDRYRELRDRNNEASRRSRMNRKQREVEMLDMASSLERENSILKERAITLEKRVKELREILLKVVLEKNNK